MAVRALLSAGAALDTCDARGQLPVDTARAAGHAHIAAALAAEQAQRDAVWRKITGGGAGAAAGLQERTLADILAANAAAKPSAAGSRECPF
jgi:ankyrin repeat protein